MTEDAKFFYHAEPGETITLKAEINGDAFVEVGAPMQPVPNQDMTWSLVIPQQGFALAYIFLARVDFEDPPPRSQVDFTISGSQGGSFSGDSITPASNNKSPGFAVRVQKLP